MENDDVWAELKSKEVSAQHYLMSILRLCLFPIIIIIDLSVKISENPTKRLAFFRFCGNPLQRFELREARIEKRENLRFSRSRLDYKLSENK